jgi:hypothetical protein
MPQEAVSDEPTSVRHTPAPTPPYRHHLINPLVAPQPRRPKPQQGHRPPARSLDAYIDATMLARYTGTATPTLTGREH